MPDPNTLQLTGFEIAQAAVIDEAAAHGELVVLSTRRKGSREPVALVCQVTIEPGDTRPYRVSPIAVLLDEDGIDQFEDPSADDRPAA